MEQRDIQKLFDTLARDSGVRPIQVKMNGRLRSTVGRVKYTKVYDMVSPIAVEFNPSALKGYPRDVQEDIIKHEYVHYELLSNNIDDGHGPQFKRRCAEIGCKNSGTHITIDSQEEIISSAPRYKYSVICSGCQKTYNYQRRGKWSKLIERKALKCSNCGGEYEITQNF